MKEFNVKIYQANPIGNIKKKTKPKKRASQKTHCNIVRVCMVLSTKQNLYILSYTIKQVSKKKRKQNKNLRTNNNKKKLIRIIN